MEKDTAGRTSLTLHQEKLQMDSGFRYKEIIKILENNYKLFFFNCFYSSTKWGKIFLMMTQNSEPHKRLMNSKTNRSLHCHADNFLKHYISKHLKCYGSNIQKLNPSNINELIYELFYWTLYLKLMMYHKLANGIF